MFLFQIFLAVTKLERISQISCKNLTLEKPFSSAGSSKCLQGYDQSHLVFLCHYYKSSSTALTLFQEHAVPDLLDLAKFKKPVDAYGTRTMRINTTTLSIP